MNPWDTNQSVSENYDAFNNLPTATAENTGPSIMDGFGTELAKAPATIAGRFVSNLEENVVTPAREAFGNLTGDADYLAATKAAHDDFQKFADQNLVAPPTAGWAAQNIVHGLVIPGTEMAMAGSVGGLPAAAGYEGLTTATMSRIHLEQAGVDPVTANKIAWTQGGITAAANMIPLGLGGQLGKTVAQKVLAMAGVQAGVNIAVGGGTRYLTQQMLANNGYDAMAKQIEPFSVSQAVMDGLFGAIVGGGFGYLHNMGQMRASPTLDDAMTLNAAGHEQVDSAPGVATDIAAANAHADAMAESMRNLMQGKPIATEERMQGQTFMEPPPEVTEARTQGLQSTDDVLAEQLAENEAQRAQELRYPKEASASQPGRLQPSNVFDLVGDQHEFSYDPETPEGRLLERAPNLAEGDRPLVPAEQRVAAAAVRELKRLGEPEGSFDGLTLHAVDDETKAGVYNPETHSMGLGAGVVKAAAMGEPGMMAELVGTMAHELGHKNDDDQEGPYFSTESPLFAINRGVAKARVATGAIIQEALAAHENGPLRLQKYLDYPLALFQHIDGDGVAIEKHTKLLKTETFAQLSALYRTNPDLLRSTMPQAFKLFEGIHNESKSVGTADESRSAVREALRARDALAGSEARPLAGGAHPETGTSTGERDAGTRVGGDADLGREGKSDVPPEVQDAIDRAQRDAFGSTDATGGNDPVARWASGFPGTPDNPVTPEAALAAADARVKASADADIATQAAVNCFLRTP